MVPANGCVYKSNNIPIEGQAHKGFEQHIHITTSYTTIHEDAQITHEDWTYEERNTRGSHISQL